MSGVFLIFNSLVVPLRDVVVVLIVLVATSIEAFFSLLVVIKAVLPSCAVSISC